MNIDKKTQILLLTLDSEINKKCLKIKEKRRGKRYGYFFYFSCILILAIYFLQIFFDLHYINYIFIVLVYQLLLITTVIPLAVKLYKGGILK